MRDVVNKTCPLWVHDRIGDGKPIDLQDKHKIVPSIIVTLSLIELMMGGPGMYLFAFIYFIPVKGSNVAITYPKR